MIIHALIGELIGENLNSIILIVVCSIISHFIIDMIPHWDGDFDRKRFQKKREVVLTRLNINMHIIDLIICLILIGILYHENKDKLMLLGAFVAVIPDLLKFGYPTRLKQNEFFMKQLIFHSKIQRDMKNWKLGIIIQFIILIILLIALV